MENMILIFILLAIAAAVIGYLAHTKKKGAKCVGCPYANQCSKECCDQ